MTGVPNALCNEIVFAETFHCVPVLASCLFVGFTRIATQILSMAHCLHTYKSSQMHETASCRHLEVPYHLQNSTLRHIRNASKLRSIKKQPHHSQTNSRCSQAPATSPTISHTAQVSNSTKARSLARTLALPAPRSPPNSKGTVQIQEHDKRKPLIDVVKSRNSESRHFQFRNASSRNETSTAASWPATTAPVQPLQAQKL